MSGAVLAAALLVWIAADIPIYLWLFRSPGVAAIGLATHGLVTATLLAYALSAALIAPVLWLGGLTPAQIGLRAADVPLGAAVLAGAWLLLQGALLVAALIAGDGIHAGVTLLAPPGDVAGNAIAQLFGTTLVEEAFYRGFVLRQLLLRTTRWRAIVLSAIIFMLSHIVNRVWLGMDPLAMAGDLAGVFGGGLLAAWIYVRTENLFIGVALHFLWNDPLPLVGLPFPAQWLVSVPFAAVIVVVCTATRPSPPPSP